MKENEWLTWSGAIAASLLLHGLLFFNTGSLAGNSEQVEPKRTATRVSFRSAATAQQASPPQSLPEQPPEPEVTESSEPPPEPPKPENRAEKAREPEPVQKPPEAQTPPPLETAAEADKAPAANTDVAGSVDDPAVIEQARQEYLRRLMAHIESYKHYPRTARRRGIQGDVSVNFTLHANGQVTGLLVDGEQKPLVVAANDAVEAAVPMPAPPQTLPLPWEVSFTMRFTLR